VQGVGQSLIHNPVYNVFAVSPAPCLLSDVSAHHGALYLFNELRDALEEWREVPPHQFVLLFFLKAFVEVRLDPALRGVLGKGYRLIPNLAFSEEGEDVFNAGVLHVYYVEFINRVNGGLEVVDGHEVGYDEVGREH